MSRRVAHVLYTAQPAGASFARLLLSLHRQLDPNEFSLLGIFVGEEGPLQDELTQAGIENIVLPRSGRYDLRFIFQLRKEISARGVDLVHQQMHSRLLVRTASSKAALILHVLSHVKEPGTDVGVIRVPKDLPVIATSQMVARYVSGGKVSVIYPGVPVVTSMWSDHADPVIGCAARLVPMKGLEVLLRAVASLLPEFPRLRLEIAGSGPLKAELHRWANDLRIGEAVSLLGFIPDLNTRFGAWSVYVQPSLVEPFGIAAAEAMMAGLPIIGTTSAGFAEIIQHGQNGLLVPPGDVSKLAAAMKALLNSADERKRLGAAGRESALQSFSEELFAREVEALYRRVLTADA